MNRSLYVLLILLLGSLGISTGAALAAEPWPDPPSHEEIVSTLHRVQTKDLNEDFEKQLRSLLKDLEKLEKEAKDKMTKESRNGSRSSVWKRKKRIRLRE
jgi:hypothetical protein